MQVTLDIQCDVCGKDITTTFFGSLAIIALVKDGREKEMTCSDACRAEKEKRDKQGRA